MGKKVTKLKVTKQTGTDNTYFATWEFAEPKVYAPSGAVVKGTIVEFVPDASIGGEKIVSFTNGVKVSDDVKKDKWYVANVTGNNALIGKNQSGTKTLNSAVPLKYVVNTQTKKASVIPVANTDHYSVHWYYSSGDGTWFDGSSSDVKLKNATYAPPENAISIKCVVKPVSKTYTESVKSGNTTKSVTKNYWSGEAVSIIKTVEGIKTPDTLGAPTVEIKQYKLTASVENITDSKCDKVEFYILKDKTKCRTMTVGVKAAKATAQLTVDAGSTYDVRCRAVNVINSKTSIKGAWGEWTYDTKAAPGKIKKVTKVKALTETSAYVSWEKVQHATSYDIEYTEKKEYFDSSGAVSSMSVDSSVTHAEITGLSTGSRYYFRIRATNEAGSSNWTTGTYSVVLGTTPSAPTTWSNKTVVGIGEAIKLYWVQNSEDGSDQSHAQLTLRINGEKQPTINLDEYIGKDGENSVYTIDTLSYDKDTTIKWAIRTAGITGTYGDWSITREVKVYTQPTASLALADHNNELSNNITGFPISIYCTTQPDTQRLISCSLSVISKDSYETTDAHGNFKMVYAEEVIFDKYYAGTSGNSQVIAHLTPADIDLVSGHSYIIKCVAALDSGLTATDELEFSVEWEADTYTATGMITIDPDAVTAIITAYCVDTEEELTQNVLLSVYRKDFDGSFTEIETGIENTMNVSVIDPHPSLDSANYRIVAVDQQTGKTTYADISQPVEEKAIIIQWNENWDIYDASDGNGDALEEPAWTAEQLRLPYNIDVSDNFNPDTELLEYAGRAHPTSYYGTQVGHTSTWNTVIPYDDKDTLAKIRELTTWMGDVYVREPSGTGYWASVTVNYSQTHCEQTIPVQLSITRVEGGK